MFNFKKIGKKVLSSVLGATLAMGGFLNTQIVKVNGYNKDDYWDPFTMLSNAKFILGNNKQQEIKDLEEKLNKTTGKVEDKTTFEREICNLLSENEKDIYDAVKKCITDKEANFEELNFIGADIKKVEELSDDVSYQIAEFKGNGNKKAIVFIVVQNNCTLTKEDMGVIKNQLASYGYSTINNGYFYNCKNVNFIIRPKSRSEKFEIGEEAISGCTRATINLQGATISHGWAIDNCKKATINLQGANIYAQYAINKCEEATINLQGATISHGWAIDNCKKATINLQGANINAEYAISSCEEATINAQGANINVGYAINSCKKATINLQGANIDAQWAIDSCKKSTINLQGATISKGGAISECEEATIYYDKSTKVPTGKEVSEEYLTYECRNVSLIDLSNNYNNNNSESNGDYDYSNHHDYKEGKKSSLNPLIGGGILAVCLISIPVIGPIIEQHIKNRKTKVNIKKTNTNINTHTNK